ncbi:putative ubiquitin hydrolase putativecysteine peptidase Clan CA family C19 [Leptomonas pyrrhocoris]|uniref:Putative ubiquitin hydrolase putativecysteine peptidase Clan CA family C19 n=1 Tax=Leptomonas pyrrhocoris TaxID=157538 RepID=A0A0M9FTV1_LEPPY|nr:putative ubiquitin hydrolase putativecysteine peptidase Clan CA family C19 [Leptomonas pyrrhocoris]KPA75819.1 putative ubiquitin hydrolase putativecysteine peptidase Clan CA family C19 [Leptomonas pyrrhocoris]|eukprot:XP_015654258.1 putative ubiquitin hydrolase putativecysteine peptidase Clan CA family C19 [Leptomonas pyrrhocoris]
MVKASDSGGGSHVSSHRYAPTRLLHVLHTVERLNSRKEPLEHPAAFLLDRVHTIELWRLSGRRLNLLQLGAALVRGVLQRGRDSATPLHVFGPIEDSSPPPSSSDAVSAEVSALPGNGGEGERLAEQSALPATAAPHGETPLHRHVHHRDDPAPPSVARVVLVQSAGEASPELYMGLLVGLFGSGVSSLSQRDGPPSVAASSARPEDAAAKAASSPQQQLSAEAARALHEVHRAARDIIHLMFAEVTKINALVAKTAPAHARVGQRGGEHAPPSKDARPVPGEAVPSTASLEAQAHDLCLRLTRLTANLYSLLSFLDFFSVEAEAESQTGAEHNSQDASGRGEEENRLKAAPASAPHTKTAAQSSKGFAAGLSSAVAAIASAIADSGSQAVGLDAGLSLSPNGNPRHRHMHDTADANPPHHRSAADTSRRVASRPAPKEPVPAAGGSACHHGRALYTVAYFRTLFDTAGHLPLCVWDILATATTVLSQCGVSWSLTHGDAAVGANFNATAAVVFSEAQLSLSRQLHRLCRRFEVLRQRVYALYPVSPVRFKVKQILDWAGFLYADDPTFRSSHDGAATLVDLHEDALHKVYPLRPRWGITADNKKALQLVAATPYTPPTPNETSNSAAAAATTAFPPRVSPAATDASKMPVSSLLATLASVGTSGFTGGERNRFSMFSSHLGADPAMKNTSSYGRLAPAPSAAQPSAVGRLSTVPGWVGMRNSGNTCFLNSVVQLLSSAVLFRDNLIARVQQAVFRRSATSALDSSTPSPRDVSSSAAAVQEPDLTAPFRKYGCRLALVLLLGELQWRARYRHEEHPVLPDYLDSQLPTPFNDHRQHDASEFLHALLDQLDAPAQPGGAVVGRWFSGKTATTMTCTRCAHSRTHVNAFWDVSIPILPPPSSANRPGEGGGGDGGVVAARTQNEEGDEYGKASNPQQLVEVVHFPGATATTTTYVSGGYREGTAAPAPIPAAAAASMSDEGETDVRLHSNDHNQTAEAVLPLPRPASAEAAPHAADTPNSDARWKKYTLQHLLLHVLHPTLNEELLHGGNALDCEYCGRRTSTALTTQLVAEVSAEETSQRVASISTDGVSAPTSETSLGPDRLFKAAPSAMPGTHAPHEGSSPTKASPSCSTSSPRNGMGVATGTQPAHQDFSPPSSPSSPTAAHRTAAGGGLPWYLALQLNRFAYQRATQSYAKVTDGVPLNEVVVVPAYPMQENTPTPRQAARFDSSGQQRHSKGSGDEEGEAAAQSSSGGSSGGNAMTVTATPVWVAYRLQTIVVHSGSTPSSGHYFALTRSPPSLCSPAAEAPNGDQIQTTHMEDGEAPTSPSVNLENIRAYVREQGAAFSNVLDVDRVFAASSPVSSTAATEAANAGDESPHSTSTRTRVMKPAAHHDSEEEPRSVPVLRSTATTATTTTATKAEEDGEEEETNSASKCEAPAQEGKEEAEMHSALLRSSPSLPPAAVSVSGAAFYENWVMLNDSNVQAVSQESMRRILNGGDIGVYSALETPYLMLYEKIPACYLRCSGDDGGEEEGREASLLFEVCATPARALQRVWEDGRCDPLSPAASPSPAALTPVELAAEAVAIFRARLHEEEARAHTASLLATTAAAAAATSAAASTTVDDAVHVAASPNTTAASAGALIPYVSKDEEASLQRPATTTTAKTSAPSCTQSRTHPMMTPSSAAANSSKRLRAKAAAYAQQVRLSRQRLTRASVPACEPPPDVEEKKEEAEESHNSASDDAVSLD